MPRMTRAVAVICLSALLLVSAAAPVAARQPAEPSTQPTAEPSQPGSDPRGERREARRRAAMIDAVVSAAESYLGLPYRVGREGPDIFDCSGLVYRIFADTGQVARIGAARMRAAGYMRWFGVRDRFVEDRALAERGDLVIYDAGSHIGLYVGEGKVISALVDGVTLHAIDGLTLELSGILKVDWAGPGGRPMPHPQATRPPASVGDTELPASLIPPLPWLDPSQLGVPGSAEPDGVERIDMRTATSRTFENDDGSFTTEIYGSPLFYLPPDGDEWQAIDLRFSAVDDDATLRADRSPVALALYPADAPDGFLRLVAGDAGLALGIPRDARRREASQPVAGEDGRFADYAALLRGGVGMRVFPRTDGVKAFVVLEEPLRDGQLAFTLRGDALSLVSEADGSVALLRSVEGGDPVAVGRIPRPLVLDSSDETGDGRALRATAASLGVTELGDEWLLTVSLDPAALARAEYPIYVDLSLVGFPAGEVAAAHTFASSRYPGAALHGYQRPESPAHPELWHGRLPGTPHYNEAYLGFPTLSETLGAATVDSAALRFYPYWQYDLDGARPTWVSRVAQAWDPRTLTWDLRPAVDAELGQFDTRAGEWSDIDVTTYVSDVLAGTLAGHGFRLHADGGGRGSWKRIVSDAGGTAEALPPRLIVTWRGLRPVALDGVSNGSELALEWSHPAVAPDPSRVQLQLSADGFKSIVAKRRLRGVDASATRWLVPTGVLEPGRDYAWRVRVRYGDERWSGWSEAVARARVAPAAGALPVD
jgi:cell wall-associated NlpC family hydrolase